MRAPAAGAQSWGGNLGRTSRRSLANFPKRPSRRRGIGGVRKKLIVWEHPMHKADYQALGHAAPDDQLEIVDAPEIKRKRLGELQSPDGG